MLNLLNKNIFKLNNFRTITNSIPKLSNFSPIGSVSFFFSFFYEVLVFILTSFFSLTSFSSFFDFFFTSFFVFFYLNQHRDTADNTVETYFDFTPENYKRVNYFFFSSLLIFLIYFVLFVLFERFKRFLDVILIIINKLQ